MESGSFSCAVFLTERIFVDARQMSMLYSYTYVLMSKARNGWIFFLKLGSISTVFLKR